MCALPAVMGALGGKVAGKVGALATGGLAGLAAHSLLKKKGDKPSQRFGQGYDPATGTMSFGG